MVFFKDTIFLLNSILDAAQKCAINYFAYIFKIQTSKPLEAMCNSVRLPVENEGDAGKLLWLLKSFKYTLHGEKFF